MSKFKIGDRVLCSKKNMDTGYIVSPFMERIWNIKWDSGGSSSCMEEFLELSQPKQKVYSLDLINEYIKTRVGMYEIDQTSFDTWLGTKHNHLESLKESVAKIQQEISRLEAQLK